MVLHCNRQKTRIYPTSKYVKEILETPEENVTERDTAVASLKKVDTNYKDEGDEKKLDEQEVQLLLKKLQSIDLLSMLKISISDKSLIDYKNC